jgi:nickel-dependent lactate racemase
MIYQQATSETGILSEETIRQVISKALEGKFSGQNCLVLIPDHTRSLPLPELFRILVNSLRDTAQLDFMVALGTHPQLSQDSLNQLVGITNEERITTFKHIGILNHIWDDPSNLVSLGIMQQDEIKALSGQAWHESLPSEVDIRINKAVFEYDHIIILGPTFPHEVAGYSGGAKYLFPGISGPEVIHATHWLGALSTVLGTIGTKHTPVRWMIHAAASRVTTPITLIALVVDGHDLAGLFIGDLNDAWESAADLSANRHIRWVDQPFQRVLSCAPPMYDELWTAAKAAYKMEPAIAPGGENIIYAPHLDTISFVHGKYIAEAGYHILPYFLDHWEQVKHLPLGVLAHCTHLRGSGIMADGIEKPNIRIRLASKISRSECEALNLLYADPDEIDIEAFKNREDEGILFVPIAGEILYKVNPSSGAGNHPLHG